MKKIVYFSTGSDAGGGIESVIASWIRNINFNKFHIEIVCAYDNTFIDYVDEFSKYNVKVICFESGRDFFVQKKNIVCRLMKYLKHNPCDIFHMNTSSPINTILGALVAKLCGIKRIIAHSHGSTMGSAVLRKIKYFLTPLIPLLTTDCFACSKTAASWLYPSWIVRSNKYKWIKNGVDCQKFSYDEVVRNKIRTEMDLTDKLVVGHVGRFSFEKNQAFLLKIFDELLKINNNAVLMFVGNGPDFEKIKNLAADLNISDKVLFLGNRNNVYELMQAMDAFILPSLYEGLPCTVVEAQAAGLPVFMTDTITDEVIITNDVVKLALNDKPDVWANRIISNLIGFRRLNTIEMMNKSGFGSKEIVQELERLYIK